MDKLKLQLAASVLYKGAGKITGIDYHNMTGLPEELSHISGSADSIIKVHRCQKYAEPSLILLTETKAAAVINPPYFQAGK